MAKTLRKSCDPLGSYVPAPRLRSSSRSSRGSRGTHEEIAMQEKPTEPPTPPIEEKV